MDQNVYPNAAGATTVSQDPGILLTKLDPARAKFYAPGVGIYTHFAQSRGQRWYHGLMIGTAINPVLPPNSPSVFGFNNYGTLWEHGVYSASSRHQGGCHILMADGAVKFVTESHRSRK